MFDGHDGSHVVFVCQSEYPALQAGGVVHCREHDCLWSRACALDDAVADTADNAHSHGAHLEQSEVDHGKAKTTPFLHVLRAAEHSDGHASASHSLWLPCSLVFPTLALPIPAEKGAFPMAVDTPGMLVVEHHVHWVYLVFAVFPELSVEEEVASHRLPVPPGLIWL